MNDENIFQKYMKGTALLDNIIVRLGISYVATSAFFAGLFSLFPQILYYVAQERARGAGAKVSLDFETGVIPPLGGDVQGMDRILDPATGIPVLMALVMSFVLTLPVTWVYRWTRPRKRYNQAFAHTLLVVPIAIASVVFLVKGSLPLAFSLAGIVAAVRFRTSLNEPMDAVYMFIVIGIGLAAGVQLLNVAFLASVFFNAIAIAVWYTDFGARPAVLDGCKLVAAKESGQLLGVSGVVQGDTVAGDGNGKKPYNAQLRIHTTKVDAAQQATIPILESNAKRWQEAQVIQKEDGTSIVVFDIRLKKSVDLSAFIREIEKSEKKHVDKVEVEKRKPVKV